MNSNAAQIGLAAATINAILLVLLFVEAIPGGTTAFGRFLLSIEAPILGTTEWLVKVLGQRAAIFFVVMLTILVGSAIYGLVAAGIYRFIERVRR